MENLDSALNELGMLSSCSKYKLDYLKVSKMIGSIVSVCTYIQKSCALLAAHYLIMSL